MTEHLLDKADALQIKALDIIKELEIFPLWEKLGKTYHVGASRTGLILEPDIDLETYVDIARPQDGFKVITEIAKSANIEHISYYNFLQTNDPGLYWKIEYKDSESTSWKIDHWLIPLSHPNAGMADRFASRISEILTNELRLGILTIKNDARNSNEPEKPRSIDIYKAVIKDGITDYNSFLIWQKNNPPPILETWSPQTCIILK